MIVHFIRRKNSIRYYNQITMAASHGRENIVVYLTTPEDYDRWALYIQGILCKEKVIEAVSASNGAGKTGRLQSNNIAMSIIIPTLTKEVADLISSNMWNATDVDSTATIWEYLRNKYSRKTVKTRQEAEKELQHLRMKNNTVQAYMDMKFQYDGIIMRNDRDKAGEINPIDKKRYLIGACNISKKMEMLLTPLSADPRMRDVDELNKSILGILEEMEFMNIKEMGEERTINNVERERIMEQGREEGRRMERIRREGQQRSVCWGCKGDHRGKPCKKGCKRCGRFHNGECRLPADIKCESCKKVGHVRFACTVQ